MRWTTLLTLLTALALLGVAGPARAQDDLSIEILRDCQEDDVLQGDYSASAMRQAIEDMPAEMDQYAACRDILSREIAAKVAASNPDPPADVPADDAGAGDPATKAPTPAATTVPQPTPTRTGRDPGIRIGPSTPEDWKAIEGAGRYATEPIKVQGRPVAFAASIGRNALPGTVVAVLALVAALALATTLPALRRRVRARRAA
jgi:hypothetical protein